MRARYIHEVGTRGQLRIYWDVETVTELHPDGTGYVGTTSTCHHTCPNTYGTGRPGCHNAYTFIRDVPELEAWDAFGRQEDYVEALWPTHCRDCGAPVPSTLKVEKTVGWTGPVGNRQLSTNRLYNNESGEPGAGDLFETHWHDSHDCPYWDNCNGIHLQAILPNGWHWDVMSRAKNCDKREDRTHRCWVIQGSYKDGTITVDKNGHTCSAGAGSIDAPGWHGFLRNGEWVK